MRGNIDLSSLPDPIAKAYRQALASFDHVDDARVKRALLVVIREVEMNAISRVNHVE